MNVSPACVLRRSARLCGRLCLGLLVLAGLCLALGVSVRPAHALSTFTVTNCSSDSQLQADVAQANHDNAGDVISFACSGDIKLTSTLTISGNMTLSGSGRSVTLDGGDSMQVLRVDSGAPFSGPSLTLNALTIAHGSISDYGGGLFNQFGTVTISNSTFAYNYSDYLGGGLFNYGGTVTISNSAFAYNQAGSGGGLDNEAANLSMSNSTVAYNLVACGGFGGGGIENGIFGDGGNLSISNSTVAHNSAPCGNGGGLLSANAVPIRGSIVADNTGGDCFNYNGSSDQGYNLSSDSSCGFTGTGSLQNTNPQLGPLASNGGPTQTLALLKGSPAIDAIPLASGLCPATDQRGHKRPDNPHESACDLGAYES